MGHTRHMTCTLSQIGQKCGVFKNNWKTSNAISQSIHTLTWLISCAAKNACMCVSGGAQYEHTIINPLTTGAANIGVFIFY